MYLKTAIRNFLRNKKHSFLNILGFSVALAACLVIFLVIQYEFSYDKHLKNYSSLFQIVSISKDAEGDHYTSGVPFPSVKYLRNDFPDYQFGELMQNFGTQITIRDSANAPGNKKFLEETSIFYGDPDLLKIFEVKFLTGSSSSLADVSAVVLSKSTALKYFGQWENALGKRINFDNANHDFQVTGVFEDIPPNSDFPFKVVASYAGFVAYNPKDSWPLDDWGSNSSNHQIYMLPPIHKEVANINQQLVSFIKKHDNSKHASNRVLLTRPLTTVHFDSRYEINGDHIASKSSLLSLAFIGLLTLLMACINFVNLTTALAVTRSKEVGVRKVLGGSQHQIRVQVLVETALVVFFAVFLALGISYLLLPFLKNFVVVQNKIPLFNPGSVLFLVLVTIITIFLSGIYPALIMSRFKPVEAIKNKISSSSIGSISLRRVLVIFQFTFSQMLVIATIIAISQMNFIQNADLGYNTNALLILKGNSDSLSISRLNSFKHSLLSLNEVKSVSFSFDAPSSGNSWQSNFAFDKMEDRNFSVNLKFGDEDFLNTYQLRLLAGQNLEQSDTSRGFLVNETFLHKVGISQPRDAIGKLLRIGNGVPKPVLGVLQDFKMGSLREEVPPLVLFPNKKYYGLTGIKINSNNILQTTQKVQSLWERYFPEYVFNSTFLDQFINDFYVQEKRMSLLYKIYAALSIFISCLGLYGLISFMVVQKTKEVGVRKVLGASLASIVYLFSREFTILIFIAFLIAAPIAWYLMHQWLQDFKYRINIGGGVFLIAILISLLIAWITVGYKALKAAMANPIQSLKSE